MRTESRGTSIAKGVVLALVGLLFLSSIGSPKAPALLAPGNLQATEKSSSKIALSWTAVAGTGIQYQVERSSDDVTFSRIATTSATTYTNTGLFDETTYWYRVRAEQGTTFSDYSNVASAVTAPVNAWRTLGRSPTHTGQNSLEPGLPPLTLSWSLATIPWNFFATLQPTVVENGRVYLALDAYQANQPSTLQALNQATGAVVWTHSFGIIPSLGQPAVNNNTVVVVHSDSATTPQASLSAFNGSTGAVLWTVPVPGQLEHFWAPVIQSNRVILQGGATNGGANGSLLAFDLTTGLGLFTDTQVEAYDQWSPALAADGTVYSFVKGNFRAHDADSGSVLWTTSVPWSWGNSSVWGDMSMRSAPVVGPSLVYAVSPYDLQAIDPVSHHVAWSSTGQMYTGAVSYADGVVYAISSGQLHARDAATGLWLWSFVGDRQLKYGPVLANNHLYVASPTSVYAVDLASRNAVWSSSAGGGWLSLASGHLQVSREDHTLDVYQLSTGTLSNQTTPPAAPTSLTAVAAGTGGVTLTWVDASTNEAGFRVERSSDGVTYSLLTLLGSGATTTPDLGLAASTAFSYRVLAYNAAGSSAWSNVATVTTAAPGSSWELYANNATHTGETAHETGKPPLTSAWQANLLLGASFLGQVAIEDGRVFATTGFTFNAPHSYLWALDATTGLTQWTYDFGQVFAVNPPSVRQGKVYVQMSNNDPGNRLFSFNAATGQPLWAAQYTAQWQQPLSPTVSGTSVFISAGDQGGCARFDSRDGHQIWATGLSGFYDGLTPAVSGTTVFMQQQVFLSALRQDTGAVLWTSTPGGSSGNSSVPAVGPSSLYAVIPPNLYAIDPATGIPSASVTNQNMNGAIAFHNSSVFVINGGTLEARSATDLSVQWTFAGDGALRFSPAIAGNYLYVSSNNNLYAINLTTHAQAATAAAGGYLAVAGGKLYAAGRDGILRAYTLQ